MRGTKARDGGHLIVESAPPSVVPVATGTQDPTPILVLRDASNPRLGLDSGFRRNCHGLVKAT